MAALVVPGEIMGMNDDEVFDFIQANKDCWAKVNFIKEWVKDRNSPTDRVIYEWIKLLGAFEYTALQGYAQYANLTDDFNEIDNSNLSNQQKQIIKSYYLHFQPDLPNHVVPGPGANANGNGGNANGNGPNNMIQPYYGGKQKQRKTRSKKTRKHKTRKH